ncbi:MAG: hypothetical protein AVDCRST_MAG69-2859 [uncultured Solirubrobacteraceae bacterium]|uniref:Uncharacterized protein n=1 Tax=uncultured Solirubrobacteraceae bacterium TaxID=1162706 RepID=A0A6J4T9R1_9ACTN|nr:MAG: hypothetical protein AVDCRST_MAG69-2859 [uncultured Solirubrobacteraceae bacterium]
MNPALDHRSDSVVVRVARTVLLAAALLAASWWSPGPASAQDAAPAPAAPAGMTDRDYLAYADRLQALMESSWTETDGLYRAGDGSEPMVNANMLMSHASAAAKGHSGASRNDERARRIAARLVASPPFVEQPSPGPPGSSSQSHAPGWVNSTTNPLGSQHLVFDADVVDGLLHAWRARGALGLPQATTDAIVDRVSRTTHGPFWRFPAIRLNQINWYALMYAATAEMTGDPTLLREDFRRQVLRFTAPRLPDPERAGNFGPGLRFHYLPDRPAERRLNIDSAEYANIVFSFTRFYEQARMSGMASLPSRDRRLLREWGIRLLAGYWTHGGYLNWDTGLGFNRWHQTKKIGLSQQALIALASTEALQTRSSQGPWAKWTFDRGLALFEEWSRRAGGVPPPVSFGVIRKSLGASSARLGVSRMQANAARAISAGLGSVAAVAPPSLYAFDPDVGRLAVSTPAYNTAIVAVNQGAFPYGGIELARLFDGNQDVAANLGGRPPSAFGLVTRSASGRPLGRSQSARRNVDPKRTPVELLRAPRGAGENASAPIGRAYAGPFRELLARGRVRTRQHDLEALHRFTPWYVETRWTARARTRAYARGHYGAEATFPSTGADAQLTAVLLDGRSVPVGPEPLALDLISYFHVRSSASGYVVVPVERPSGALAHAVPVTAQWSAPSPGPSLVVTLATAQRFKSVSMTARVVPVRNPSAADATARRLGAR